MTHQTAIFEALESEVRSYCRAFPVIFTRGKGHLLFDSDNRQYIDFFSGAGVMNYGHNPEALKQKLIDYINQDGICHSLDMHTRAKAEFLKRFEEVVLKPKALQYKIQFPGPTGTNAVEAALKIARKVTSRTDIMSFTNGFHGMTLGSLSVTGNKAKRAGAGIPLSHTTTMPFDGYMGEETDTLEILESYLTDASSGVELPAAFIVETVQAEGGVNVASSEWLKRLAQIARRYDVLLIVDDIQVGCGRTGSFFSFERAGIQPDIVCLSKSLSGFGLPFALTLIKPEYDLWAPGEHNGTFRGHNLAFVTATEALRYWENDDLKHEVEAKSALSMSFLQKLAMQYPSLIKEVRGCGLIQGIDFNDSQLAGLVSRRAFDNGLLIETSGAEDNVLKLLPPLTISVEALKQGLAVIHQSLQEILAEHPGFSEPQMKVAAV